MAGQVTPSDSYQQDDLDAENACGIWQAKYPVLLTGIMLHAHLS